MTCCRTNYGKVSGMNGITWWGMDDDPLEDGNRVHRIHCPHCRNILLVHGDETMDGIKARLDQHRTNCSIKDARMAYNNYLHCMKCGAKALYWDQWEYIGCAHCPGDHKNAERGSVEVYCPECTADRNPGLITAPGAEPKPSTWEPASVWYEPDHDLHCIEEGGVLVEYHGSDPQGMYITHRVSPDEKFMVSLPLRALPVIRVVAARVLDLAARDADR